VLGEEAAGYIEARLKDKAKVVLLTHDQLQFLAPRFAAMRDSLKDMPGVTIVADISPLTVDEAGGAATMRTILLAEPDIDVVLGADTVVLGALAALRESGKARPDQFLGGIDGEPAAVAEIKSGGPYKASVSLASPIFAYAMGQHAADWLEGKSIPAGDGHPAARADAAEHRALRSRRRRSRVCLQGPGASRVVSQDVRQYLLRHPGEFRQFPVVVGAEVGEVPQGPASRGTVQNARWELGYSPQTLSACWPREPARAADPQCPGYASTNRTSSDVCYSVAFGGRPDMSRRGRHGSLWHF
jgi:Periplasmic binding protein domain